eukprot:PhF_6_TR1040/c2_g1_i6/m.2138
MNEYQRYAASVELTRRQLLQSLRKLGYLDDLYQSQCSKRDAHKQSIKQSPPSHEWKETLREYNSSCMILCEEMESAATKVDTYAREILGRCNYRIRKYDRALKRRWPIDEDLVDTGNNKVAVANTSFSELEGESSVIEDNEVTYCVCNRPAYGRMIECDNRDCLVSWFHLDCVGLKRIPKTWYCPKCKT